MAFESDKEFRRLGVPNLCGPISTGSEELLAVGAEGGGRHRACMGSEAVDDLSGPSVPQRHGFVAGCQDLVAIGAEGGGPHTESLLERLDEVSGLGIPQFRGFVFTGSEELFAVGTELR